MHRTSKDSQTSPPVSSANTEFSIKISIIKCIREVAKPTIVRCWKLIPLMTFCTHTALMIFRQIHCYSFGYDGRLYGNWQKPESSSIEPTSQQLFPQVKLSLLFGLFCIILMGKPSMPSKEDDDVWQQIPSCSQFRVIAIIAVAKP